jgi:hypothetical protein
MQEGKERVGNVTFLVLSANPNYKIAIFGEQTSRDIERIWCDVSIHTVWFVNSKSFL